MESHREEQAVNRSNTDSVSFLGPKRTPEMDDSMLEASVTEKGKPGEKSDGSDLNIFYCTKDLFHF